MFSGASNFDQPLGDWNVAKVTSMHAMFDYASAFNQPIGDWKVDKVTNMWGMFRGASALPRTVNGTGHTGPSRFSATSP